MEGPGLTQSFSPWGMTTSVPWVLFSPNTCILRNEPGTLGDCVVFVEPHVLPTHHEAQSPCTGYWETLPWESKCLQEAEISAPAIQTQALIRFQVTFWPQHHDSNNNYKHLGGFGCARYMAPLGMAITVFVSQVRSLASTPRWPSVKKEAALPGSFPAFMFLSAWGLSPTHSLSIFSGKTSSCEESSSLLWASPYLVCPCLLLWEYMTVTWTGILGGPVCFSKPTTSNRQTLWVGIV